VSDEDGENLFLFQPGCHNIHIPNSSPGVIATSMPSNPGTAQTHLREVTLAIRSLKEQEFKSVIIAPSDGCLFEESREWSHSNRALLMYPMLCPEV